MTRAIVKEIIDLCRGQQIEFVLATLTSDAVTSGLVEYCKSEGVKTVDIYVDRLARENNNLPYD